MERHVVERGDGQDYAKVACDDDDDDDEIS